MELQRFFPNIRLFHKYKAHKMLNRSTQSLTRTALQISSQVAAPTLSRGAARAVASAGHPYRLTSAPGPSSARQIHHTCPAFAQSTTPNSSLSNPAEKQAQAAIEDGTGRMEAGDWQGAKECYERRYVHGCVFRKLLAGRSSDTHHCYFSSD